MAPYASSSRHGFLRAVLFSFAPIVFVGSIILVAEIVRSALTPKQVKSMTETAHDFADDLGFHGVGDWILEQGSLDGVNDMSTEQEGEFGHLLPKDGEEEANEATEEEKEAGDGDSSDGAGDGEGDSDGDGTEGGNVSQEEEAKKKSAAAAQRGGDDADADAAEADESSAEEETASAQDDPEPEPEPEPEPKPEPEPEPDESETPEPEPQQKRQRQRRRLTTPRRKTHPLSVLQRATAEDVRFEPYPHLIVRDALPAQLYAQLAGSFPANSVFQKSSNDGRRLLPNVRYNIPAHKVLNQNMLGGAWKDFLSYHTSPDFYEEVVELFGVGGSRPLVGAVHRVKSG